MLYANTSTGRREAAASGERGTCPGCDSEVVARYGEIIRPHWAHLSTKDCDPWAHNPMTDWHYGWQQQVPEERREVVMGAHRADVVTPSGWVVEFQHSGLKPSEVEAREAHYGQGIWVVDMRERTRIPGWVASAKWRVFFDHGNHLTTPGHRRPIPHTWLVEFMNREQDTALLNWGHAKTAPANFRSITARDSNNSCSLCGKSAIMIDPRDNKPKHKVCAEDFETYGLAV